MGILYAALGIMLAASAFFYMRYRMLRKSIRRTDEQLKGIVGEIEENRILKLDEPEKELEALQVTINNLLGEVRSERIGFEKREKEFQKQIENISHDLRTPLTAMKGYLKLIDKDCLSADDRESLETVIRKTGYLERLVNQFYDYSRFSSQDYVPDVENVDIARLLRETIVDYYPELTDKKLDVQIEIPDAPVWVKANRNAAERVFLNLLQNAGRYAEHLLWVKLEAADGVIIRFINDVSDFTDEDLSHLFQRFYVKDSARSREATGLGLTISRYLTEKMG
ncbi:MAG: HAMP domain-containing sensor histidine kinase, partial [Lachnospiraceae bacterium]|nr:HAMP domain-containing sensor histidine kinase [Lachnospiraceae bacterium]